MLMAYSHLAHNCQLGNEVILANSVQMGGHVEVGDYAFLGGGCVFHQNIRIGKLAIVSGFCASRQDVAPFGMYDGRVADPIGINKVGLRRRGYDTESRTIIKNAYKILFFSPTPYRLGLEEVEQQWGDKPYIQELVQFVRSSKRGLSKGDLSTGSARRLDDAAVESLV
jgi:UDP-N-acetylglucosamine acyltransferase